MSPHIPKYSSRIRTVTFRASYPLVKQMYDIITKNEYPIDQIEKVSGVNSSTIRYWFNGDRSPSMFLFNCVLNALGYRLVIEKIGEENGSCDCRPNTGCHKTEQHTVVVD